MKRIHFLTLVLLSFPIITSVIASCCNEESFMARESSQGICNWEQGDGRCDEDGDCCSGRQCSALGFCESR